MSSRHPPRATSVRTPRPGPRGIGIRHDKAYYKRKLTEAKNTIRNLRVQVSLKADVIASKNSHEEALLMALGKERSSHEASRERFCRREKELLAEIKRLNQVRPPVDTSDSLSTAAHNAIMASYYAEEARALSGTTTDTDHSTESSDQEEDDVILTKISERVNTDANTSQRIHSFPAGNSNARFGGPCAICLEEPQDPVSLNCDHCFCRGCVIQWFSTPSHRHSRSEFKCPTCRTD